MRSLYSAPVTPVYKLKSNETFETITHTFSEYFTEEIYTSYPRTSNCC